MHLTAGIPKKNHADVFSHSVLAFAHLFINTYTLTAVPEHAMG
jgi:hypothetical protein